uniref:Uncharacterized protein n=1 Tax=Glossina austeni TaxID=7395 RepID=A0A1A9VKY1_GLOAU
MDAREAVMKSVCILELTSTSDQRNINNISVQYAKFGNPGHSNIFGLFCLAIIILAIISLMGEDENYIDQKLKRLKVVMEPNRKVDSKLQEAVEQNSENRSREKFTVTS